MVGHSDVIINPIKTQKNIKDIKLGQEIRKLRVMRGYSQDAIARKIGITFQQFQKYERGINRVCVSRLIDICNVFGVHPSYFIDLLNGEEGGNDSLYEQESDFIHNNDVNDPDDITNKEILHLIRSYKSISNVKIRKKIVKLIQSLGEGNNE